MARYDILKHYLKGAKGRDVEMTFAQIEDVLGRKLPPSAHKHRAWWSNNPDNNVMTQAWLEAGYQTVDVNLAARTLTFKAVLDPSSQGLKKDSVFFGVAEGPVGAFRYGGPFAAATQKLSPRAQEWLDMKNDSKGDKEDLILSVIESLASKSLRKSIVDKYSKLNIGSGNDSVDLIREERDGR